MPIYLLDSCTLSYAISDRGGILTDRVKAQVSAHRGDVWLCPTVVGEFFAGIELLRRRRHPDAAARISALLWSFDVFYRRTQVLATTQSVSEVYGAYRAYRETTGRKIQQNDYWIAAYALAHGAVLVTADTHFEPPPDDLVTIDWTAAP